MKKKLKAAKKLDKKTATKPGAKKLDSKKSGGNKKAPKPAGAIVSRPGWDVHPTDELRVHEGFVLSEFDRGSTLGWTLDEKAGEKRLAQHAEEFSDLQERLFADGRTGGSRSILLVLQGMDTAGKGGVVRHVVGLMDPQGVHIHSFGKPTPAELSHHYLWRVRRELPRPGIIGVFDRSHYEDVLTVRVNELVPESVWSKRYSEINRFEEKIVESGTTIIKCALLISRAEQARRLEERLDRPDKYWKFNPDDLTERAKWPAYDEAYQAMLSLTSTEAAPWFAIPADHKWYARLAVSELVLAALRGLDLGWPAAQFDVAEQKAALSTLLAEGR